MIQLEKDCQTLQAKIASRAESIRERENTVKLRQAELVSTLKSRNVKMYNSDGQRIASPIPFSHPLAGEVSIKLSGSSLIFPTLLLYPEHTESDFIAEFDEHDTLRDHLEVVLEQPAPWDQAQSYNLQSVAAYFVSPSREAGLIGLDLRLGEILAHPEFAVVDGVVVIYILVRKSDFEASFLRDLRR